MLGVCDVIVCDGFTGNVVLKSIEGAMLVARTQLRAAMRSTAEGAQASEVIDPLIDPVIDRLDTEQTGTALLLGVRGVSCISHGSSDAATICRSILTAASIADDQIVGKLRDMIDARS